MPIEQVKNLLIVSIPDATDLEMLPPWVAEGLDSVGIDPSIPNDPWLMSGTISYNGRRLVLKRPTKGSDYIDVLIESVNSRLNAGWEKVAMQSYGKHIARDENGNPIYVQDDEGNDVLKYDVIVWKRVPRDILNYLQPIYATDEQGNPVGEPIPQPWPPSLITVSGAEPWAFEE